MDRSTAFRSARGAAAALGLAAVVVTSACSPLTTPLKPTGGTTGAVSSTPSATPISAAPMPTYHSPWDVRVATPHTVVAPAITAYPWAADQTNGNDPYGMTKRQCVSYAAWYLNSHGTPFGYKTRGPKGVATFGNATTWDAAARVAGFTVSTRPVAGSIAQWHSYESSTWTYPGGWSSMSAGSAGHVAIVTAVNGDGTVNLAQFNMNGNRSYNAMSHVKAPRYIYVPLSSPRVP